MNNREKAILVFGEELGYIKSESILEFVLECFNKLTPDYFWEGVSSSSGRFHPAVSNKEHGLVIHTKLCVWWARKLYETMCKCGTNTDAVIAACLLHDLQKFGTVLNDDSSPTLANYSSTHGVVLALQLEKLHKQFLVKNDNHHYYDATVAKIANCVALHMGRWTEEDISSKWKHNGTCDEEVEIVHMADYCASRKVDVKMDELNKWQFPKEAL